MRIKYVGPHDAVDVDGLGTIKQGQTVECPDSLAGSAPHVALEKVEEPDGAESEREVHDPGDGLLAQVDNWQPGDEEFDPATAPLKALKAHAAEHEIELGEAKTKEQIAAVIIAATTDTTEEA
jgi:hypothetical protein